MSVTSAQIVVKDRYLTQIDKLVHSHTFRKAESLCKLLRYLAEHALAHPGVALKEYQIATEVFGRPENSDPQADSAIRVQAGRLRLKLLDYYSHEGATDTIIVEVPNGSYSLIFHDRELPAAAVTPTAANVQDRREISAPARNDSKWIIAVITLSILLAATLTVAIMLFTQLKQGKPEARNEPEIPAALQAFWSRFTTGPEAPWVIFSNAAFVGRPETGMRYLNPAHDSHDLVLDHYTGVGEVLAVHQLDQIFSQLNRPLRVKRGSLFSLDDARNNDLIFVGSPAENLTLLDLPGTQEFVFKRLDSSPHKGDLAIVNVHPEPGESEVFYPSNSTQPLVEDYAVVAVLRGLDPNRHVMILAGTTTIGTQAAVEYVCGKDSVEELLRNLSARGGSDTDVFEALLKVKITRGVPVGTQLIATRRNK